MALTPGSRLGQYEILSALGVGGMGEVYRARDSKLDREVALKILPEAFVHDSERVARFQREARTLASLNHPNIGGIHGVEDARGVTALVLELIEGPTLADRIAQGPIPLDEAVPIARQIADALEAAHDQGIVHRDLKPANIKMRNDGTVKVLDFGLAKALEPEIPAGDRSNSPTLSLAATRMGVILGTAAYMAPEQAKSRAVDKRADVWAFGCVLYEMLTGKRPFDGEDVSDTLAFVLTKEPDWGAVPTSVPTSVRRLLRRCLEKDRRRRLRDIGDARLELDEALAPSSPLDPAAVLPRRPGLRAMLVAAGVLVGAVAGAVAMWLAMRTTEVAAPVQRFPLALPESLTYPETGGAVAVSPDGSRIVFVASQNGKRMLFVRPLDQLTATAIAGTDDASYPFFSPDGEWIAFFAARAANAPLRVKKVPLRGGPADTVLEGAHYSFGGSWGADGTIVVGTSPIADGRIQLMRVPADGGKAEVLRAPDPKKNEFTFGWPHFLPDGKTVLFSVSTNRVSFDNSAIAVLSLETGAYRTILERGTRAQYVSTGHIVYWVAGSLMAVPFDLSRLQTTGPAVPVLDGVRGRAAAGNAGYDVSPTGFLVYVSGGTTVDALRTLVWVDRTGREEPLNVQPRPYNSLRLSPDGSRIALAIRDQENDIWVWDIARRTMPRVTSGPAIDSAPVWTPDGSRVVFASFSTVEGWYNLFWKDPDTLGAPERLSQSQRSQFPTGISPDGKRLVIREINAKSGSDIQIMDLAGNRQTTSAVQSPFSETEGEISPDGRWLAYQSNESGRDEVYVSPFPDTGAARWPVSTEGGSRPVWSRNSRELFYLSPAAAGRVMSVEIREGARFAAGTPQTVFEGPYVTGNVGRVYDVTLDGKRFLMMRSVASTSTKPEPPQLIVVLNWFEELKRRVPAK